MSRKIYVNIPLQFYFFGFMVAPCSANRKHQWEVSHATRGGKALRNRGRADNNYRPFSAKSYLTLIIFLLPCGKIEYQPLVESVLKLGDGS